MIESQKPMMLQSALAFEQIIKVKIPLCIFNFNGICAYSVLLFLHLLLDFLTTAFPYKQHHLFN